MLSAAPNVLAATALFGLAACTGNVSGGGLSPAEGVAASADSGEELAEPFGVSVVESGPTSLTLQWEQVTDGAVQYTLQLGGRYVGKTSDASFQFEDLSCGTTYTLGVRAESDERVSARVVVEGQTTDCEEPSAEAGVPELDAATELDADMGTALSPEPPSPDAGIMITPPTFIAGVCAYLTKDFVRIAATGVHTVRLDRPSAEMIAAAHTQGLDVLPIADYGYSDLSGVDDPHYPPLPENRGSWAKRIVDLWRGMEAPPRVIEAWNEPYGAKFWKPSPDPAAYLELVKALAKEVWAEWPTTTILVAADTRSADYATWRKDLLSADTSGFLTDPRVLPTTHNYTEARTPTAVTSEPCAYDLGRYECAYDDFKAHGHGDPKVWITEFGWESDTPSPGYSEYGAVTEQQQADYTLEALELFRKSGKVAAAFSYMYKSDSDWNYNWLRPDNAEKPVVFMLKQYLAQHASAP